MQIPVNEIQVKEGRRSADADSVRGLADSIREVGLLNPLTVDSRHTLIAGLHRLEAVKLLGWTEVECTVSSLEGLAAELAEIDENIVRSGLSAIAYGEILLRRKEVYEALHPEAKHGGDRKSGEIKTKNFRFDSAKSFAQDTAEKLGVVPRTVELQIQTAKNLTPEAKEIIKETDAKITRETARKLSRLEPEQQKEAAEKLAAGEIRSVEEYTAGMAENAADTEDHTRALPEEMQNAGAEAEEAEQIPAAAAGKKYGTGKRYRAEKKTPVSMSAEDIPAVVPLSKKGGMCLKEVVTDLKDPDKDCSGTPDSFLEEYGAFVRKFQKEIGWYSSPYYDAVFPLLNAGQLAYLRQQTDAICAAAEKLYKKVEKDVR